MGNDKYMLNGGNRPQVLTAFRSYGEKFKLSTTHVGAARS